LNRRGRSGCSGSAVAALVGAALASGAWTAPLAGQDSRVHLGVAVAPATVLKEGASVTSSNLLADAKTRELLRNGFPARIHYRLELWRSERLGDDRAGVSEWDVLVAYDPTSQQFTVRRLGADHVSEIFGGFPTLPAAEAQFGRPYRVALRPDRSGRYYYNLIVDVQTLTMSDLDALEQWLRGPSAPQHSNVFRGIWSGLGTLVSRILGGDKRKYEQRSEIFDTR